MNLIGQLHLLVSALSHDVLRSFSGHVRRSEETNGSLVTEQITLNDKELTKPKILLLIDIVVMKGTFDCSVFCKNMKYSNMMYLISFTKFY